MGIDRQTIRRVLLAQLVEMGASSGRELLERLTNEDSVRQVRVCSEPDIAVNVRVEIAPDQSDVPAGGTRLWVNANDFDSSEGAELIVVEDDVLIGDWIRSLN